MLLSGNSLSLSYSSSSSFGWLKKPLSLSLSLAGDYLGLGRPLAVRRLGFFQSGLSYRSIDPDFG